MLGNSLKKWYGVRGTGFAEEVVQVMQVMQAMQVLLLFRLAEPQNCTTAKPQNKYMIYWRAASGVRSAACGL